MVYQAKLNEKYTSVLRCISNFQGTSYKNLQDTATSSFFVVVLHQQISFLQLFRTSFNIMKKIFATNFPCLMVGRWETSLTAKSLNHNKFFVDAPLGTLKILNV